MRRFGATLVCLRGFLTVYGGRVAEGSHIESAKSHKTSAMPPFTGTVDMSMDELYYDLMLCDDDFLSFEF